MSRFKYILFGVLFYVVFVIVQFPADRAYALARAQNPALPIQLGGISGTVWAGQADVLRLPDAQLQQLVWNVHALKMLLGRLELDWRVRVRDGHGDGIFAATPGGDYAFENVQAQLPAALVAHWLRSQALQPEGNLILHLETLEVEDHALSALQGALIWSDAGINVLQPLALGDLKAEFVTTDEGMQAQLSDGGGPLQLEGLATVQPDGNYEFNGAVAARDASLTQALQTFGRADAEGKVRIAQRGNLQSLGIRF